MVVKDSKNKKNDKNIDFNNDVSEKEEVILDGDLEKTSIEEDNETVIDNKNDTDKEDVYFDNKDCKKKSKKIYLFLILCLVFILSLSYFIIPKIILVGDDALVISYDQEYVESGYNAKFLGKDITS